MKVICDINKKGMWGYDGVYINLIFFYMACTNKSLIKLKNILGT